MVTVRVQEISLMRDSSLVLMAFNFEQNITVNTAGMCAGRDGRLMCSMNVMCGGRVRLRPRERQALLRLSVYTREHTTSVWIFSINSAS